MAGPAGFDPNITAQMGFNAAKLKTGKELPGTRTGKRTPAPKKPAMAGGSDVSKSLMDPNDTYETNLTPLIGGDQIFPTAREMIRGAEKEVNLNIYQFGNRTLEGRKNVAGVTDAQHFQDHDELVNELIAAKERGVKVQVLMDSSKRKDGKIQNHEVAEHLKANGVEVLRYPKSKANISHVKLLVVDEKKAMIGGMNWGSHSPVNHDANILIQGREAAELKHEIFDRDVRFAGGDHTPTELNPHRENKVDVLTTRPVESDGGSSAIKEALLKSIDGAKKNVHAELFCMTDADVVDSLKNAHQRGVDVKVLLDPNLYLISRKAFHELKEAGVPVKWYKVDVQAQEKLHGKWATIDGKKTMIGSANWSRAGLEGGKPGKRTNHEANVLIRDEETTSIFDKTFNDDWENKSSWRLPPRMRFS